MNYTYLIKDSYLIEMDGDQINFLWTFKDLKNNDFNIDYIEKNKWMDEIFNSLFDEELTHEEAYDSFTRSREHLIREQPHIIEN
jgi:hypothetical protein